MTNYYKQYVSKTPHFDFKKAPWQKKIILRKIKIIKPSIKTL